MQTEVKVNETKVNNVKPTVKKLSTFAKFFNPLFTSKDLVDVKTDTPSDRQNHITAVEEKMAIIIDNLIQMETTHIIMNPDNHNEFFIINEEPNKENIIIVDAYNRVIITNIVNQPYSKLTDDFMDTVIMKLKNRIKSGLNTMINRVRQHELEGLDSIITTFEKREA